MLRAAVTLAALLTMPLTAPAQSKEPSSLRA